MAERNRETEKERKKKEQESAEAISGLKILELKVFQIMNILRYNIVIRRPVVSVVEGLFTA